MIIPNMNPIAKALQMELDFNFFAFPAVLHLLIGIALLL
jgi:hypothetical protein